MNMIYLTGSEGYIGSRFKEYANLFSDLKTGKDAMYYEPGSVDCIYHLAAQSGVPESMEDPMNTARNNVLLTVRMVEMANKLGAMLIFPSSGAANDPQSPYGWSKKVCEEYIEMRSKKYVILQFSSIFGDKPKGVVDNFRREKICEVYGDGSAVRDFVHVDDIVRLLIKAKELPIGKYQAGSGKGVSVLELAKASGKPIDYKPERIGDKERVVLKNEVPGWKPKINVLEYIC